MKILNFSLILLICLLCSFSLVSAAEVSAPMVTEPPAVATLPVMPGGETGYFLIKSSPSGADVYFDGSYKGETDVTVTVSTTGNPSHTIRIQMPGYDTYETTYTGNPSSGETILISAVLHPSSKNGQINVQSYPSGATAQLDRQATQITPAVFSNVPGGNHEIAVFLSGYQTFSTSVYVQQGQTAVVNAQLSPIVNTGTLSVSSTPSGAAVYVDGIYWGVTPTTIGSLSPGQHTVILSKAGYQDWIGQVNIQAGSVTSISPTLPSDPQPQYGLVSITSYPSGASVYADGVYVGQTRLNSPLVFTQVKPGYHELLLSKTGYQDYSTNGNVIAGQQLDLTITLNPSPQQPSMGSIAISSSPSGAEVYLDNVYRGLSPINLDSVSPGMHTVQLSLSGYQDWQSQVQITAGQTTTVSATLLPSPTPTPTQTGLFPFMGFVAIGLLVMLTRRKTQ